MTMTTPPDDRLCGPVHGWFGLSYANNVVMPRTLMQSMPEAWQARMVACLRELDAAFAHIDRAPGYDVTAGEWKPANECSAEELKLAGAEAYWVDGDGETVQEVDGLPSGAEERYAWRGDEVDGHARIFVPGREPVPHYNRGRTYVEPCPPEPSPDVSAADELAQRFHEAYERLAPEFGYETRRDSAVPWADVPERNRRLMTAVCAEILAEQAGAAS